MVAGHAVVQGEMERGRRRRLATLSCAKGRVDEQARVGEPQPPGEDGWRLGVGCHARRRAGKGIGCQSRRRVWMKGGGRQRVGMGASLAAALGGEEVGRRPRRGSPGGSKLSAAREWIGLARVRV